MSNYRYRCNTCNTDLGSDGGTVESHLTANPSHSVEELLYYDTQDLTNIEGTTRVVNNEIFSYDNTRGLWLSTSRATVGWGIPTTNRVNVYMRLWGGMTPTTTSMGFYVYRDSTITALVGSRSAGTGTAVMSIRPYGSADITSYTLTAGVLYGANTAASVAVSAGTRLCCYLTGTAGSSYPQMIMELAERL